jgi:uncharacterized RDD family membrane protein YckC
MNIGFLMYLADVAGDTDTIFFALALILSAATAITTFIMFALYEEGSDKEKENLGWLGKLWTRFAVAAFCFVMLCILTPSKKTVYLMAASSVTAEIAEQAKSTPEFEKLRKILNDSLDSYIPEKKEKKNDD